MNINLSKFHKIECDDNCTTLEHPSGHQIKIAHKGLSHEMKSELDQVPLKLAKGGYAKFSQKFDPNIKAKNSKPSEPAKAPMSVAGVPPRSATRAYTEPEDAGPDVVLAAIHKESPPFGAIGTEEKQHYPPCINPSCKSFGRSHPNCRCYGGGHNEMGAFAEGGEVEYYCDDTRAHRKGCEYYKGGEVGVHHSSMEVEKPHNKKEKSWAGESEAGQDLRNSDINDSAKYHAKEKHHEVLGELKAMKNPKLKGLAEGGGPEDAQNIEQYDKESQGAQMAADASENKPENVAGDLQSEVNDYQKDVSPQAPQQVAQNDVPQEQSPEVERAPAAQEQAAPQEATPVQQFQQHKEKNLQELSNEAQMFQQDMDAGHIKPETYHDLFAKKSTLGKIGTMFGLLLGGAGSGLSGQPNMLLGMMNKEIENDLAAQQHSVQNKQNFLKINQQGVDSATKAYALSRVQMNNAALHSLVSETQKLPQGPQKEQMMQTLAMMNQSVQTENFNIMDRAATASALSHVIGGGGNTTLMKSGLMGPEMKEVGSDVEQKTIPGIPGRAQRPIKESDREQIIAMKVLSDKVKDVLQYAKSNKGSLNPNVIKKGEQKAEELVNFYNQSLGGALTGYKLPWLQQQIGKNPTTIFQNILGSNARLQEIKDSNDTRMGTLLNSYGYNSAGKSSSPSAQSSSERESKSGRPMIQKNGKWVYK